MILVLTSLEATAALAHAFAACVADSPALPPVLLHGQLGAGKTTFIRELVQTLPGSENAEVSSPSFNILNLYPTTPPVGHFDLYRTEGRGFDPIWKRPSSLRTTSACWNGPNSSQRTACPTPTSTCSGRPRQRPEP